VFKIVSMPEIRKILLCRCAYGKALPSAAVALAAEALGDAPKGNVRGQSVQFTVVDDLCELAQRPDDALAQLLQSDQLTVLACAPRAVRWLLAKCSPELDPRRLELFDLRDDSSGMAILAMRRTPVRAVQPGGGPSVQWSSAGAQSQPGTDARATEEEPCEPGEVVAGAVSVDLPRPGQGQDGPATHGRDAHATGRWMPWFPVIDYDRCVNCLQCLSFCLFGVYQKGEDGKIAVARPHNCKTYCPACSRVCPRGAIMFPKHPQPTINGREIPTRSPAKASNVLEGLVKGDIYKTLRRRQDGDGMLGSTGGEPSADQAPAPAGDEIPSAVLESLVQKHIKRLADDAGPGKERQ
jgi:NAD-dependent dihydropyrimidine dehydrogenase PreA subunit